MYGNEVQYSYNFPLVSECERWGVLNVKNLVIYYVKIKKERLSALLISINPKEQGLNR